MPHIGINTTTLEWGRDDTNPQWTPAPHLPDGGELSIEPATRAAAALDQGNLVHAEPGAVLRPGSARDIATMLRFCHTHNIPWAAQGTRHTTNGQSLVENGLAIDMRALRSVTISTTADGTPIADAQAGALWSELATEAAHHNLRAASGLPAYTELTIGGVASAGGITANYNAPPITGALELLEIVTPQGELRYCSPTTDRPFFDTVCGGFGRFGIITRAQVRLCPVKPHAATFVLSYGGNYDAAIRDQRLLAERGQADELLISWHHPNPDNHRLAVTTYYDPTLERPTPQQLLHGLLGHRLDRYDRPYLEHALTSDPSHRADWDHAHKVNIDLFLTPWMLRHLIPHARSFTPASLYSRSSYGTVFIKRRTQFHSPYPRLPEGTPVDAGWVHLLDYHFDDLGQPRTWYSEANNAIDQIYSRAIETGATVYPVGTRTTLRHTVQQS